MKEKKICPIFTHAVLSNPEFKNPHKGTIENANFKCRENDCAWFNDDVHGCAIKDIGISIAYVGRELKNLKDR